jgi:hypothetical protein
MSTKLLYVIGTVAVLSCTAAVHDAKPTPTDPARPSVAQTYSPRPETSSHTKVQVSPNHRCTGTADPGKKSVTVYWEYSSTGDFLNNVDGGLIQHFATRYVPITCSFFPPRHVLVAGDDQGVDTYELWELKAPHAIVNMAQEVTLVPRARNSIRVVLTSVWPSNATPGNLFWNRGKPNSVFVTFVNYPDLDLYELTWPAGTGQGSLALILDDKDQFLLGEEYGNFMAGDHSTYGFLYFMYHGWGEGTADSLILHDTNRDGAIDMHRGYTVEQVNTLGLDDPYMFTELGGVAPEIYDD